MGWREWPGATVVREVGRPIRRAIREVSERGEARRNPALHWLREAHRQQPTPPDLWDGLWAGRRKLVAELVAGGKSFLDMGGMYGISGEISFLAEQHGASKVVLFDGMDPSDAFDARHKEVGSKIEFFQGDLHDADDVAAVGTFDVVWCAGVVYHTPNPLEQFQHLRRMTNDGGSLLLGTHVMPEVPGIEQLCMLYPGISDELMETFAQINRGGREKYPGMMSPFDTTPLMSFANMWFGISPSALRSMLHFNGFDVVREFPHAPFWMDMLCRTGGVDMAIYPPARQSAGRVLDRYADLSDDDVPAYAQRQVRALRGR